MKIGLSYNRRLWICAATTFVLALTQKFDASAQSLNCPSKCSSANPYCMIVPSLAAGPDVPWALRNLYLMESPNYPDIKVSARKMLAFFGMEPSEDPCQRGDTVISNGRMRNSGTALCQISLKVPLLSGATNLKIGFDVPLAVQSQVQKAGELFVFDFSSSPASNTPTFWIDNELLNKDWGGKIKQFTFAPRRIVVETENGCIRYDF